MSAIVNAIVLTGPVLAAAAGAALAYSEHRDRPYRRQLQQLLAERPAPDGDGGEPAPVPVEPPVRVERLADVLEFPLHRRAA